jgi:FG-GAP-like repeat/ASPIC and UnbV
MFRSTSRFAFVPRLLFVLALIAGGVCVWYFAIRERRPPVPQPPDQEGAYAANTRGVGLMERFEYAKAVDAFREVVQKHPRWVPGRVNLAIALLNHSKGASEEIATILESVLKDDPWNPHAHYTLGMLYRESEHDLTTAYQHFSAVLRVDPKDAYSWLQKGDCHPNGNDSPEAIECYRTALRLDPYLNVARHKLFLALHDEKERAALNAEFSELRAAFWERVYDVKYYCMGPYAEVIGRTPETHPRQPVGPIPAFQPWPQFHVTLADGARWAGPADFGQGPEGDLRRLVRERFGATMVLFDYDRDGRPDVFLLSAVVRNGKLGNLLLHNEGNGRFLDMTKAAGLADSRPAFGCVVADFDNDDFRDLLLTGPNGIQLYRNVGNGTFADVTAQAGMDKVGGVCLGAAWFDIDQDCDLDAIICRLADTPAGALDALNGKPTPGGRVEVFINRGDAEPVPEGQRHPPLRIAFTRADGPADLLVQGPVTGLVLTDLDADKDVDLIVLAEGKPPVAVRNDRLLRFGRFEGFPAEAGNWNGGAVLDVNHDGRSDILLLSAGKKPQILLSRGGATEAKVSSWFEQGPTDSPPLKQAVCVDLDSDGWTDVVGVSVEGKLVFLHNDGLNRLVNRTEVLGTTPGDLASVAVADLDGDCHPDLLVWSTDGLHVLRGQGNGNSSAQFELTGRYQSGPSSRTNADGIGCKVVVQLTRSWTGLENTTLNAGLGQSRLPLNFGIGRASTVDVVRILWPDGVPQAELALAACKLHTIQEVNRKPTSCPVLFVWDGERFRYITDFLGGGATGESGPDGSVRPPRPEESVKIEPGLLVPKDGKLLIKIAEPMDEVMYLDRVELLAIDHPKQSQVHPDERFVLTGPPPTQKLLVFDTRVHPLRATDHKGRDLTAILKDRDGKMASGFARRSWLGYAEEHFVDLDFGDQLSKVKPGERLFLVMTGWTDYPYAESIYAATQAGVPTITPVLERMGEDGKWKDLGELGFPAGLPRVMTKEVTGLVEGPSCRLRIRTNLQIHWDEIAIAPLAGIAKPGDKDRVRVMNLTPTQATLAARGFMRELKPHGPTGPVEYDDSQTERVEVTPWRGMLTRLGDVTELLLTDEDQFAVCGPGEELTIAFDASKLPAVPAGYSRSYVLRSWGYSKDTAPTTVTGGLVEPLPFRGAKNFPFLSADERRQADVMQAEYRKKWNTRPAAGGRE